MNGHHGTRIPFYSKTKDFCFQNSRISGLIKTITKFSNAIGYQQPDFSINQNYNKILERDWLPAARFEH